MASPKPPTAAAALIDWVRERFSRDQGEPMPGEDIAQRRGFIISMCVVIAVVLWFTLSIGETYPYLFEMETQVINVPQDTALAALPPPRVQVHVSGQGTALFGLRFNAPPLVIDATQGRDVDLATQLGLPQGVEVESVTPRSFVLQKEKRVKRRIPIQSRAKIEAALSYDLVGDPVLLPDSIDVSGARSIINALAYWPTETLQHTGLKDLISVEIALKDTLAGLVDKNQDRTTLTATALQFTEQTRILRVDVTGLPTTMQRVVEFDPATVEVTYRIPVSQFDAALEAQDFFATVSYEVILADTTGLVQPEIHRPTELLLHSVESFPSSLRYYESLIEQ